MSALWMWLILAMSLSSLVQSDPSNKKPFSLVVWRWKCVENECVRNRINEDEVVENTEDKLA